MKASNDKARVGEIRPTQLMYTFGIGSIVDLPYLSVMVMGVDEWDLGSSQELSEPRLLAQVKKRLGDQVEKLLTPPIKNELESTGFDPLGSDNLVGVPCSPFPRWVRCPACGVLAPLSSGLFKLESKPYAPDRSRFVHLNCRTGKPPAVIPVRFMVACENGHLDDFPWMEFIHGGGVHCSGHLRLDEMGASGEAVDVQVKCITCGKSRRMYDAFGEFGKTILPECRGLHPHLRRVDEKRCEGPDGNPSQVKALLLGASNAWFPCVISTISIPREENRAAACIVENWVHLKDLQSLREVELVMKHVSALARYTAEELWKGIELKRQFDEEGRGEEPDDVKSPEWAVLSNPDEFGDTSDFVIEKGSCPEDFTDLIEKVVLVKKMREVRALVGFTRIDSPHDFMGGVGSPDARMAPISRSDPRWVPSSEVRGEGIFIQFSENRIQEWLSTDSTKTLEGGFLKGHCHWRKTRNIEPPEQGFPGMRFILLHSFAHALMREFSLACGYSTASIRERIYSTDTTNSSENQAGVLIYTVASDSEGTLGGLVSLATPDILNTLLGQGLDRIRFCSSDPLCAEHAPDSDGFTLHAAACHSCLFLPETSCECGNRYLDRSVLVETVDPKGISFFPENCD